MHTRSLEHAARFGRVAALALVGFLIVAPAPDYVFAQDGGSVATGDGGSTGEAGGGDTSSAGTNTSGSVAAGDGTADSGISSTGTAETSGSPPADATTTATSTANVVQDNSGYDATSSATGGGEAGGGGAIGSVTATASADTTGVNPTASASTKEGGIETTSAVATFGAAPNAVAPGGKEIEKQTAKKSVAIAIAPDGSYSIAVAKKNSAYAKSGANYYGKTLNAAVGAMVAAYAKATRSYGLANASASAWASSRGGSGYAKSSSWTNAFACVGSGCQRKTNLSRRSLRKLLVRCTWHERNHILTCPPNIPYASARR